MKLGSHATLRARAVPNAEHQGRGAVLEHRGRVRRARVCHLLADGRVTERHCVEDAVAQKGVGDAVRSLKRGDLLEVLEAFLLREIDLHDREGQLASAPSIEQGFFHPVRLRGNRVEQHGGDLAPIDTARLHRILRRGVALLNVRRREDLVGQATSRLETRDRADRGGVACDGLHEGIQVERAHQTSGGIREQAMTTRRAPYQAPVSRRDALLSSPTNALRCSLSTAVRSSLGSISLTAAPRPVR